MSLQAEIVGGMGNQLFIVGALISLAKKYNVPYLLKKVESPSVTKRPTYWDTVLHKLEYQEDLPNPSEQFCELNHNTYTTFSSPLSDTILKGYFQSDRYLDRDLILDKFQLTMDEQTIVHQKWLDIVSLAQGRRKVFVHVRRGDYLLLKSFHFALSEMWYRMALRHFDVQNDEFLFFSDDLQWCREHFADLPHKQFIDEIDYHCLFLMSKCDGGIIANSSFSWWGAYLMPTPGTIVCPSHWYHDHTNQSQMRNRAEWISISSIPEP